MTPNLAVELTASARPAVAHLGRWARNYSIRYDLNCDGNSFRRDRRDMVADRLGWFDSFICSRYRDSHDEYDLSGEQRVGDLARGYRSSCFVVSDSLRASHLPD